MPGGKGQSEKSDIFIKKGQREKKSLNQNQIPVKCFQKKLDDRLDFLKKKKKSTKPQSRI